RLTDVATGNGVRRTPTENLRRATSTEVGTMPYVVRINGYEVGHYEDLGKAAAAANQQSLVAKDRVTIERRNAPEGCASRWLMMPSGQPQPIEWAEGERL